MKIIIYLCQLVFLVVLMTGCSYAPGVPGLKTSLLGKVKPQKEGVDYKVIILDAKSIQNIKPFDYAKYVRIKKKQAREYSRLLKIDGGQDNSVNKLSNVSVSSNLAMPKQQLNLKNRPAPEALFHFKGITEKDNKISYQYYIGKGDALNITIWDHPELTDPSKNNAFGGYVVGSDGAFYFPYVGKIRALGKTIEDIRDELSDKLATFITKPQVSVSIAKYRSQKIYTSGAVAKPTTLSVEDTPITVRDAISKSGGLIPFKYTGYATLARKGENISIDLDRMLRHNDNRQNFLLKDGDRLNVVERNELDEFNRTLNLDVRKENTISKVRLANEINSLKTLNPLKLKYDLEKQRSASNLKKELERELRLEQAKVFVMGEVLKPGSVKYQIIDGMTLAEAINDAGSFKEDTVNPKGIFVIRKESSEDKIPTVYQLPIASVQSLYFAELFDIRPRDIVYVTAMPSIRWNRVLAQILPSLTLLRATR